MKRLLMNFGMVFKAPGHLPGPIAVAAIGDIHGEFDLFRLLLDRINDRTLSLGIKASNVQIIVLGDFIDKGPNSNRVLNYLYILQKYTHGLTVLRGNHEQMMLDCITMPDLVPRWLGMGGWQTLESYGVDPSLFADKPQLFPDFAHARFGNEKLAWLDALPHSKMIGDYFFCHAGVRPGVTLADQDPDHLLWIRDEFTQSKVDHGAIIVHGHAEEPRIAVRANRIGLDTCAWQTGQLSAAVLTGSKIVLVDVKRRSRDHNS